MRSLRLFFIRCLITPLAFLPLQWAQGIGAYLGLLLIRSNKKRAHIALSNIRACFPNKTLEEQQHLLNMTAMEAGKWFMESPYVWFRQPNYLINKVNIHNPEILQGAYAKGNGVVLVLPHQGNWEMLNFCVPQCYPFGAMYRPIKSPLFEKMIFDGRIRVGSKLFAANAGGVRQALKALKRNEVVAVLSDHLPSEDAGVYAPFFGHPALTGKLTQTLAKYNHSEVLLATVLRKPKGEGFEVYFSEINGIHNDDPIAAATALNQAIEKSILLAPEQYQWVYRRFAKPPAGIKSLY
jgi:Kdo2-lipid IVA lauroyltransferase/acyltransferase